MQHLPSVSIVVRSFQKNEIDQDIAVRYVSTGPMHQKAAKPFIENTIIAARTTQTGKVALAKKRTATKRFRLTGSQSGFEPVKRYQKRK
ncbi:MAG: hypothetical protein V2I56_24220 [Desulfobacteraceae bacterium]|nr:hypothetical protein [Desulfobacteraceae bacterium]